MTRVGFVPSQFQDRIQTTILSPQVAMDEGAIEPGIAELVHALNAMSGVDTIASCHGHVRAGGVFRSALLESRPYVLFRADVAYAQNVAAGIARAKGPGRLGGGLYYCWTLHGYFYPPEFTTLAWVLKMDDGRLPREWSRQFVSRDVSCLARIVSGT